LRQSPRRLWRQWRSGSWGWCLRLPFPRQPLGPAAPQDQRRVAPMANPAYCFPGLCAGRPPLAIPFMMPKDAAPAARPLRQPDPGRILTMTDEGNP
jgi:hypothetical protein